MLSLKPNTILEKELKRIQGLFVESSMELQGLSAEEAKFLNRFAFISNIGASTRIENAVLTDHEIEWVDTILTNDGKTTAFDEKKGYILDKLSKDRERSIEEVAGCRQVLMTIYRQAKELSPLTETIIRGLHHDLLRYDAAALKHAGGYKKIPNQVLFYNHDTGEKRVVLDPAPPGIVTETSMAELVKWYNDIIREHPWPTLIGTEFVFRFLAIHPFQDGNGRLGRALFILSLLQSDDVYLSSITPYLAIDRHIEQNRTLYYSVLNQCSDGKFQTDPKDYDLKPLAWFFMKIIESSLGDVTFYRQRYRQLQELSSSAIMVFDTFKANPEKRLKVGDIVRETNLPRRTVQYALRTLTNKNFLQLLGRGAGSRYQLIF